MRLVALLFPAVLAACGGGIDTPDERVCTPITLKDGTTGCAEDYGGVPPAKVCPPSVTECKSDPVG